MAQKKRGTNPIRITLTEDQISDIIQSAAKTRRGLKVESLEDRIAPSVIGGPMFNPGVGDLSGDGGLPQPNLPGGPDLPGLPGEPNLPGPFNPPSLTDTPTPPLPNGGFQGPPLPGDLPVDPNANIQQLPDEPAPGGIEELPQEPAPGGVAELEPEPTPGGIAELEEPGPHVVENPVDPDGGSGGGAFNRPGAQVNPNMQAHHNPTPAGEGTGVTMPSNQEIEDHRRNILRQLRGN